MSLHWTILNKLVLKCHHDLDSLKYIHSLIDNLFFIEYKDNLMVKNSMIAMYGSCSDISSAKNIFDAIEENKKDIITVKLEKSFQ